MYDIVNKELRPHIDNAKRVKERSLMDRIKDVFVEQDKNVSLGEDKELIKKLRMKLSLFEQCIRNFEETYI